MSTDVPETVELIMIVDRSGSMMPLVQETIENFNGFLDKQKQLPGEAWATLVLFNQDTYQVYDNCPLAEVEPLSPLNYAPDGTTALLNAVGRTVKTVYKRHKKQGHPDKTVLLIITDGQENASKEFTREQIADLLTKRQKKNNWDVFYLGANVDAFAEAGGMGIVSSAATTYEATSKGVQHAYSMSFAAVAQARTTRGLTTDQDAWKDPDSDID